LANFNYIICLLALCFIFSCTKEKPGKTELFEFENVPFEKLSAYNFFEGNLKNLEPSNALLPYNLDIGLFSNYAEKQRLIYFPKDGKASYINDAQKTLAFPHGTIIIKTFYYLTDLRDPNSHKHVLEPRRCKLDAL